MAIYDRLLRATSRRKLNDHECAPKIVEERLAFIRRPAACSLTDRNDFSAVRT
jgi:hypothetical protein